MNAAKPRPVLPKLPLWTLAIAALLAVTGLRLALEAPQLLRSLAAMAACDPGVEELAAKRRTAQRSDPR